MKAKTIRSSARSSSSSSWNQLSLSFQLFFTANGDRWHQTPAFCLHQRPRSAKTLLQISLRAIKQIQKILIKSDCYFSNQGILSALRNQGFKKICGIKYFATSRKHNVAEIKIGTKEIKFGEYLLKKNSPGTFVGSDKFGSSSNFSSLSVHSIKRSVCEDFCKEEGRLSDSGCC